MASRDPHEVNVSSRLIGDLVARFYDTNLPQVLTGAERLLDLGCGKAPLNLVYKGLAASITLTDWENSQHPNPHLDVVADLTQPLPFGDSQFDVIILSDVLEHIPTPELLFSEITRVLAPGGNLLMNVPFMYWVHEAPYDFYRYTEFALRRLAEKNGLSVKKLEVLGGGLAVLIDLLAKLLVRMKGGSLLAKILQASAAHLLERRLRLAPGFPLAYGMVCQKLHN